MTNREPLSMACKMSPSVESSSVAIRKRHTTRRIRASGRVGHTLIETDMDSLGLVSPGGRTVYLLVEPDKTYYYGHGIGNFMCQEMSANAFWLSVAAESRSFRHYSISKKSGVIELKKTITNVTALIQ